MTPSGIAGGGGANIVQSQNNKNLTVPITSTHTPHSTTTITSSSTTALPTSKGTSIIFEEYKYKAKQLKKQRKHDMQKRLQINSELIHSSQNQNLAKTHKKKVTTTSGDQSHNSYMEPNYRVSHCHMTFIFDPNGRFSYWMGFIVSCAFLYNFWVIIYRYSFNEINSTNVLYWLIFDYTADFLYVCDIAFNFRTGFLEEGVLQTDPIRLRHHYMNTTRFYVDCLCLMPLDILYLSIGYNSMLRCFRLVKIYRFWHFLDRHERHTNYPNLFRTVVMLHYLFAIFHWNACLSYFVSSYLSSDLMLSPKSHKATAGEAAASHDSTAPVHYTNSVKQSSSFNLYNEFSINNLNKSDSRHGGTANPKESKHKEKGDFYGDDSDSDSELLNDYLRAFYLSAKLMTLITEIPNPRTNRDFLFCIFQLILALLLFSSIIGHVGYIVSNLGNARKEFQAKFHAVKTYMSLRRVPVRLQDRVIRWFDFLWTNNKSADDNQILDLLPYKLRAEIAIHVHLDTLKKVEIFQNTEAGFLNELVLRLKPVLYSPGDFICRKGEVGKEMYIVNGGKLQVISDNGKIVLATLKAGSYFGEISILNMGASGNRRTASVKSVGYSDLFCLSKEELWEVLKEYPAVRVKLEAIAVKRLEKHNKPLSEIVNLTRSKSTPGLSDASAKIAPLIAGLRRHCTLPTTLLKRPSNIFSSDSKIKKNLSLKFENTPLAILSTLEKVPTVVETLPADKKPSVKNLQFYLPASPTSSESSTSCLPVSSTLSSITNQTSQLTPEHYAERENLNNDLKNQIEKLKDYIFFLESENSSLAREKNGKKQRLLEYNNKHDVKHISRDIKVAKARPESDFDEYSKV